jgi:hypothetical protein
MAQGDVENEMEARLPVTDKEILVVSLGCQLQKVILTMHKTDMKTIKVNRNEIKSVWKGTGVV